MVMEVVKCLPDDDESDDLNADAHKQLTLDDLVNSVYWPEEKKWGSLAIASSAVTSTFWRKVRKA